MFGRRPQLGQEAMLHRERTRRGPCRAADLRVDVLDVIAHRLGRDHEALGDRPIRQAVGEEGPGFRSRVASGRRGPRGAAGRGARPPRARSRRHWRRGDRLPPLVEALPRSHLARAPGDAATARTSPDRSRRLRVILPRVTARRPRAPADSPNHRAARDVPPRAARAPRAGSSARRSAGSGTGACARAPSRSPSADPACPRSCSAPRCGRRRAADPARRSSSASASPSPARCAARGGALGDPARVARRVRGLQIGEIGHRLERQSSWSSVSRPASAGSPRSRLLPARRFVKPVEQVRVLDNVRSQVRIELPGRPAVRDLGSGFDTSGAAEHLDDVRDHHDPDSKRDLLACELRRRALTVPAFEHVLEWITDFRPAR